MLTTGPNTQIWVAHDGIIKKGLYLPQEASLCHKGEFGEVLVGEIVFFSPSVNIQHNCFGMFVIHIVEEIFEEV